MNPNTYDALNEAQPLEYKPFKNECNDLRRQILTTGDWVRVLMGHPGVQPPTTTDDSARDIGEMKANIMLAFRHLEDARMRLGKAIQAFDGGVSVYDN